MTRSVAILLLLCGALMVALATSVWYGLRTRRIAIEGWEEAFRLRDDALLHQDQVRRLREDAFRLAENVEHWRRTAHTLSHGWGEEMIRRDAGLPITGPLDHREAALAVRDLVYRVSVIGPEPPELPPWERWTAMMEGSIAQVCSGMTVAYEWALAALGIPTRTVRFGTRQFIDGERVYDTHAALEIHYDGAWHLSDPTFNVCWECTDGRTELSTVQMRECLDQGHRLVPRPGTTQIAGRTVEEYYLRYDALLAGFDVQPAEVDGVIYPRQEHPSPQWFDSSHARCLDRTRSLSAGDASASPHSQD